LRTFRSFCLKKTKAVYLMKSYKKIAPLFVIIGASLWGVDGIVLRPALFTLPVTLVVFLESTIVAILLTPIFLKRLPDLKNLSKGDWAAFIGVALLGGAIGTMAITKALFFVNFVNLSIVILIQKLQPVFAIIFALLLLQEKPKRVFYLWASLAIAGAYLLTFGHQKPVISATDKTGIAALYAIIAAISFAASTVLSKRALRNIDYQMGTYIRFSLTALFMLMMVSLNGNLLHVSEVSEPQWIIFMIIAFTSGGTAIFLYYYGLKEISASVATICELAFPLTAVILEYWLHGNILDWAQWLGVILLISSIARVSQLNNNRGDSKKVRN
jgi:drug/metabolite transporter (DMT)-like permease